MAFLSDHPSGLKYLFGTEAMERFSYYGMRAILVLYLTSQTIKGGLEMARPDALSIYATYTCLVYLTPVIGGLLADKYLGARKSILIGGIVMMFGEICMMFPSLLYMGLALLILGNGFFKPNISTIVGHLYTPDDPRRDSAFTIFYMGINLGALFSPLICGTIGEKFGFMYGFAGAAVGMAIGIVIFLLGQKTFGAAGFPPNREVDENSHLLVKDWIHIVIYVIVVIGIGALGVFVRPYISDALSAIPSLVFTSVIIAIVVGAVAALLIMAYKGGHKEGGAAKAKSDLEAVSSILVMCFLVFFFWLGFEQAGGTMTLFAETETDRVLPLINWEVPASYFQSVNPAFILILAPLFSILWTRLDQSKTNITVVMKMGLGLVMCGIGFILLYIGQQTVQYSDSGEIVAKANMLFLIGVYFLHTTGELCLSPIGLSLVTKLSPARMVSLMMGIWFLSSAAANLLAGNLEAILKEYEIPLYAFLIGTSFGAAIILLCLLTLLHKWMHIGKYAPKEAEATAGDADGSDADDYDDE